MCKKHKIIKKSVFVYKIFLNFSALNNNWCQNMEKSIKQKNKCSQKNKCFKNSKEKAKEDLKNAEDVKEERKKIMRKYKYLITIARRDGAEMVFHIKTGKKRLTLPLPPSVDSEKIEEYLKTEAKIKDISYLRYVGSYLVNENDSTKRRYFKFIYDNNN